MNEYENFALLHSKSLAQVNKNLELEKELAKMEWEIEGYKGHLEKIQKREEQ